jgi:hypothetical protein
MKLDTDNKLGMAAPAAPFGPALGISGNNIGAGYYLPERGKRTVRPQNERFARLQNTPPLPVPILFIIYIKYIRIPQGGVLEGHLEARTVRIIPGISGQPILKSRK